MPHQQQDMTYSPAHGQNQNQIVAAIRSSNPPHPDPSIPPPSPPAPALLPKHQLPAAAPAHDPRLTDRSLRESQTSTATTDIPGSVSGSSSGSYPFSKGVVVDTGRSSFEQHQQYQHQYQHQQQHYIQQRQHPQLLQQQAAFVHPNAERTSGHESQYDGRRGNRGEKLRRSRVEGWTSPHSMSAGSPHRTHYRLSTFPGDEDDQDDGLSEDQGENAFIVLVSLGDVFLEYAVDAVDATSNYTNNFLPKLKISFLVPPFTLFAALYTFFILLFTTLISPFRLLPKSTPLSPSKPYTTQLTDLLSPPLHIHKSLIGSHQTPFIDTHPYPYSSHAYADSSSTPPITPLPPPSAMCSIPSLILVHLLSPILTVGLLLASWTAAFFWVFAMILGNPDGTERRDDGRAAVLGVRNWWKAWLKKGG